MTSKMIIKGAEKGQEKVIKMEWMEIFKPEIDEQKRKLLFN